MNILTELKKKGKVTNVRCHYILGRPFRAIARPVNHMLATGNQKKININETVQIEVPKFMAYGISLLINQVKQNTWYYNE